MDTELLQGKVFHLELADELERILRHRRARIGEHHHGVEIEIRNAHDAARALRKAIEEDRLEQSLLDRVRSTANALHVTRPKALSEILEILQAETLK
jgi:hypothetical protein